MIPSLTSAMACSFAPTDNAPREARSQIARWLERLEPEVVQTMQLLVSEMIAFSVRMAAERGSSPVDLCIERIGARLRAEIVRADGRFVFPNAAAEVPDLSLSLVDELADRWGMTRTESGTLCWLELDCWPAAG